MHVRQQIAEAVAALLNDGTANTWGRVFVSRVSPARDVTPYLLVVAESESVEADAITPGHLQQRDVQLTIRARDRVLDGEVMETALAAMQSEIETRVTGQALRAQLSGVRGIWLNAVTSDTVADENERIYSELALEWTVRVYTTEGQPDTLQ